MTTLIFHSCFFILDQCVQRVFISMPVFFMRDFAKSIKNIYLFHKMIWVGLGFETITVVKIMVHTLVLSKRGHFNPFKSTMGIFFTFDHNSSDVILNTFLIHFGQIAPSTRKFCVVNKTKLKTETRLQLRFYSRVISNIILKNLNFYASSFKELRACPRQWNLTKNPLIFPSIDPVFRNFCLICRS